MHIDHLFCSTHSQSKPISGQTTIKTETGLVVIQFNEDECRRIQDIAVEAYERNREDLMKELRENTPALIQLGNFSEAAE